MGPSLNELEQGRYYLPLIQYACRDDLLLCTEFLRSFRRCREIRKSFSAYLFLSATLYGIDNISLSSTVTTRSEPNVVKDGS